MNVVFITISPPLGIEWLPASRRRSLSIANRQRTANISAGHHAGEGALFVMVFSVSGVLLLGIIVFILFRKDGLKVSHMIVCMLLGFYLASTSIAPNIKQSGASIASFISGLK